MRPVVDESRLMWALALSILLHALLLTLLPILRRAQLTLPPPPALLDVDVLPPPQPKPAPPPPVAPPPPQAQPQPAQPAPAQPPPPPIPVPKNQIVSPPDAGEEKPPENTRLLSDRDNTVKQESVHRSDSPHEPTDKKKKAEAEAEEKAEAAAEPKPQHKAVERAAAPVAEARPRPAALPKLDQLLPGPGDLALAAKDLPEEPTPAPARAAPVNRNLLASRGNTFSSFSGTSDYLPTLREGDITLLNTKAEMFAPFVRRVAMRVFQHLEIRLKQAIRGGSGGGREFAVVEAVMNKQGQLVNARVVQRESNSTLAADRQLLAVTTPDVFFDSNPPPGAEANDGNIHFVLLVDLMVQTYQNPRTGAPSAGYNGVAGVGLDAEPKHN